MNDSTVSPVAYSGNQPVSRSEFLKFAFEYSRDENTRTAARLALLETKSQLTAAVASILISFLPGVWVERKGELWAATLCALTGTALFVSLFSAIKGSIISNVSSPKSAEVVAGEVADLLDLDGKDISEGIDGQSIWGEASASYRAATAELKSLIIDRSRALFVAQVSLLHAFVFAVVLVAPIWLGPLVGAYNHWGAK